ncbi:MAG: hypothetical protein Q7K43_03755 [Candidatus Woesearchaeota archaeon]|nr:hypothetical protein [Candidatus Woesearchaeota archaeon]
MPSKASLNTVILYALFVIPLIIAVLYTLFYIPAFYSSTLSSIPELHSNLLVWAIPNLLTACNTELQHCTTSLTSQQLIAQLLKLVNAPEKQVGIQFTIPGADCQHSPFSCQYNSDQIKNPSCTTIRKGGWCAYQQLTGNSVSKQIRYFTPERLLITANIRTQN